MVRIVCALFALCGLLLFLRPAAAVDNANSKESAFERVVRTGELRCGYSVWPPFLLKDPNTGAISGIVYDVLTEIGSSLDLRIDWSAEVGFGNYTEDLNSNRIDVMCATLWADAGRIKNSLLIEPFLYSGVYLVVRADDSRFDKAYGALNDPKMKMAGVDGDITLSLANRLFPLAEKLTLPPTGSASELAEMVKARKADAMFSDLGFFSEYAAKNPGKLKILKQNPAWVFGERMAVKPGETKLKYMLDTAIDELSNSGKIDEIMKKYPGTSTWAPKKDY